MLISWKRSLLATATCLASIASMAQADILCGSPNTAGQIFKAGDIMSLSIAADGKSPLVSDVNSLTATLYCTMGNSVATINVSPPNKPFSFTVPSVGNITTPTGTDGPCLGNKFYVLYSGILNGLFTPKFGPVNCAEITITPAPYYVPPVATPITTAPTTPMPTIPTTTKKPAGSTTTTTPSTTALPSETPKDEGSGGGVKISTPMIVVIALAAVLILALMIVAIFFRVRRGKRKRMEDTIMPCGGGSTAAAAAAAAELSGAASKTTMPKPPQLHSAGKGHYGEDSYAGYGNQPSIRHPHGAYYEEPQDGYNNQRQPHGEYFEGHDGYNIPQNVYNNPQEDYHNPYYAQKIGGAGGGYQGTGNPADAAAGYGYAAHAGPQGHYPNHPGDHAFYNESFDQYPGPGPQALPQGEGGRRQRERGSRRKAGSGGQGEAAAVVAAAAGYYPPPPPVRGPAAVAPRGPTSLAPPTPNYGQLDTGELIVPDTVSAPVPSGNARAPQEIPEPKPKGSVAGAAKVEAIPMKELLSAPHV
ncbi:hypothetical protein BGZ95_001373 [Linnemannia exigua]|uniref:Uncharacterized protein n=1 Tax=Linnemannia exigua TaxID=604196 RepID=A0AAD4D8Q7_9FUNG|nr:hypothetical protein BGZ95_001373 [Linnemannia exigua]